MHMDTDKSIGSTDILVVDDEWEIGELVVFLLTGHGYRAHYAANGQVALRKLAEAPVDLVLTDFTMPVMDGCDLIRAIRAMDWLAATPVLVLSAMPEEVVRKACPRADAFLSKPFTSEELLDSVRHIVGLPKPSCSSAFAAVGVDNIK